MKDAFVSFDSVRQKVHMTLESMDLTSLHGIDVYFVRNLYGKVRVVADEPASESGREVLVELAARLTRALGAHGHPVDTALLTLDAQAAELFGSSAEKISDSMFWVDRMVIGNEWRTVDTPASRPDRYTLFSVKGGLGRSTTAAVLAWHLARQGERVLVVDLDVESPGLGSAVLDEDAHPEFGVVDWFVEDLVGQGRHVIARMAATPAWGKDLEGSVTVVPAHGRDPGEYLTKLGRTYLDTNTPWNKRIESMITQLEAEWKSTVVLIESRSGLHDIAAATVTDLGADVLLFAIDSASNWTDYEMLFAHWGVHDLAKDMRERLSIVSALTPEVATEEYLAKFAERSWHMFRDHLYDDVALPYNGDDFSFDLHDVPAPHRPLPIYWNRGMAAGSSLHRIDVAPVTLAYSAFLQLFDGQLRPTEDR